LTLCCGAALADDAVAHERPWSPPPETGAIYSHPEPLRPPGAPALRLDASVVEVDLYPAAWRVRAHLEISGPAESDAPWTLGLAARGAHGQTIGERGRPRPALPDRVRLYARSADRSGDVELPQRRRTANFVATPSPQVAMVADTTVLTPELRRYGWEEPGSEAEAANRAISPRTAARAPIIWWAFPLGAPPDGAADVEVNWLQAYQHRTRTDADPAGPRTSETCTSAPPTGGVWNRMDAMLVMEHADSFQEVPATVALQVHTHAPQGSVTCISAEAEVLPGGGLRRVHTPSKSPWGDSLRVSLWVPVVPPPGDDDPDPSLLRPILKPAVRIVMGDDPRMDVSLGGSAWDQLRLALWVPPVPASGPPDAVDDSTEGLPPVWRLHERIARFARDVPTRDAQRVPDWLRFVDEMRAVALDDPDAESRALATQLLWELFGGCTIENPDPSDTLAAGPTLQGCAEAPDWPAEGLPTPTPITTPGLTPRDVAHRVTGSVQELYWGDARMGGETEYAGATPFANDAGSGHAGMVTVRWEMRALHALRVARSTWMARARAVGLALLVALVAGLAGWVVRRRRGSGAGSSPTSPTA
jgi:hypothetical protein